MRAVHCYISESTDPYTNLAFEDWILRSSDPQSYVLYLWRNRPTIVIGRNQNPWKECNLDMMASRDVWLARRTSGGGTVYHDLGNSNYTVVMPRTAFTRDWCAEMVSRALLAADIPAYVNARHDVTVDELKISGSAFKLTSKRAFHHGTMLIDADLSRLHGCLHSKNKDVIEAKGVDSVRSRVANLRGYSLAIDHPSFCDAVMREFEATLGCSLDEGNVTRWDGASANLDPHVCTERERISQWDWLYGQTPEFVHRFHAHFAWASVFASITARRGLITGIEINTSESALEPPVGVRKAFSDIARLLQDAQYDRDEIRSRLRPLLEVNSSPFVIELCEWVILQI
ncbi:hypothetical protein EV179_000410 [Coemansia sp. RSA 487]|nr:hypothetical protein LPJ74_002426 [Coemansia sp. RSA 1843]KAJ2093159.1 hypothetical protein IW138_000451 [Coemansia sp. RSA 986]KAJ2217575.1 hypothetical protein EV179_000410 [Coemansia sp. RSA 487]